MDAPSLATLASDAPFFTGDLPGLVKVVMAFGGFAAVVVGAVWKIMQGPLNARVERIADDSERAHKEVDKSINGVGARVNLTEARVSKLEAFQTEAIQRLGRNEDHISDLRNGFAKIETVAEALRRELGDMQVRLSTQITREGEKSREQIHKVELEVAKAIKQRAEAP